MSSCTDLSRRCVSNDGLLRLRVGRQLGEELLLIGGGGGGGAVVVVARQNHHEGAWRRL
jgi:hypothetical protein